MNRWFRVFVALLLAPSALGLVGGCGLLDAADGITITLPAVEYEFELDADPLRGELQNAIDGQLPGGLTIDLSGMDEIPPEVCVDPNNPDTCVATPTIQQDFEIELPPQQVDLSDEDQLKSYIEAGKVKDVQIKYVSYDITQNSFNFNLPALDIYMDDHGASAISESSEKIATWPAINAGVIGDGTLQFTTNGKAVMSNYLMSYKLAVLGLTKLHVDTAVTRTIPKGRMKGTLKGVVTFTVDPL